MRYNTDRPPEKLEEYVDHINRRWNQLNDLNLSLINEGIKYLFYINAGGCVAVLAFISTAENALTATWPWTVLLLFFAGLVLVGMLNFARYHAVDWIQYTYNRDTTVFYSGDLDFDVLDSRDCDRVKKVAWIPVLAYCAFLLFIAGGVKGFLNYKEFIKKDNKVIISNSVQNSDQKNHIPVMPKLPPQPQPPKDSK